MPTIHLRLAHPQGAYPARVVRGRAREYLHALGLEEVELSILLTTDREIRSLNRRFRGKDRATDVLSFPAGPPGPLPPGVPRPLGDLAISVDTARRVAAERGHSLALELSRYLAHGLLHLLGYDHERSEREARRMARKEAELLGMPGMLETTEGAEIPASSRRKR